MLRVRGEQPASAFLNPFDLSGWIAELHTRLGEGSPMFEVRIRRPHPAFSSVIAYFSQRLGRFAEMSVLRPLHARPNQFLEFYLADPYQVEEEGVGFAAAPAGVLVGPCLTPGKRLGFVGEVRTFTIHFQPTGLSRLFGLPMSDLTDQAFDGRDVFGRDFAALDSAMRLQTSFEARVGAAEQWLGDKLDEAPPLGPVDWASRLIARSSGRVSIDQLAARSGMSARQLQRRFLADVGATPKTYARVHRFSAVLEARRRRPDRAWADLASEFGFADQAHLIRETRALAGRTPEVLIQELLAIPEQRI
jgi:AraC-like DNA-binding protein